MSTNSASVPTLAGIPLKYISLVTLTVQNSSLILIMHYSRVMPVSGGRYYTSTAVLLNEVIKLLVCSVICIRERGFSRALSDVFANDSWKLAIPAGLYTLQNTLQYVAVSNLDAATFQVTYQLKILTTAFFAVTILHRLLSRTQWLSLFLLTLGIAVVQIPDDVVRYVIWGEDSKSSAASSSAASSDDDGMSQAAGLIAVAIACVLSGLAGIYFEKVLKGSKASLWTRNVQLSFYSIFPALFIGVLGKDGANIRENGFFHGYNPVVWIAIVFQALGGIIVALCVKYADNIAKNFATSISILISSVASLLFFDDFTMGINFIVGAAVVVYSTVLYSRPAPPPPRKSVAEEEGMPMMDTAANERDDLEK